MNKEKELGYKIIKIQTVKFDFNDLNLDIVNEIFKIDNPVKIKINFNISINREVSEINIDVNSLLPKNENEQLVYHSGRTVFKVLGLNEFYYPENNDFKLPDNFMVQLFSLSYSHSRALLAIELSKTNFKDKYFLPVIDPNTFFNNFIKSN